MSKRPTLAISLSASWASEPRRAFRAFCSHGYQPDWTEVIEIVTTISLIRIAGLDDSVATADVIQEVAKEGGCSIGDIRAGKLVVGPRGDASVWMRVPVAAAKKVSSSGRLMVGWVSARVVLLAARPKRCFRCLDTGHVAVKCQHPEDRSRRCFRCGTSGHKAAE
ncbi:uncharacterized protein LOC133320616 [Danaus plexippus]|uniref:uncharacterized protein LOC133320616 n=1 Tax=Danaus plexippus TaxID=13037 RepID=UPI002AAF48F3|nr:uncharacterized protein LOC133320616 [Danaus plexippus]